MPNYSAIRAGHAASSAELANKARARATKGPADRVKELQDLRAQVLKKKATPGYDPQMQLQSIDHEIARLTRAPK